jgi:hypothetical protein
VSFPLLATLVLSCGRQAPDGEMVEVPVDSLAPDTAVVLPEYPRDQRGRLAAVNTGAFELGGSWEARAGLCSDPDMLQLIATESGMGTLILLQLPDTGSRLGSYPVTFVDSGFPFPPAAQIAVQVQEDDGVKAFQADSGAVELTEWGDRVSGRLRAVLREINWQDRAGYAAAFRGVAVTALGPERCRTAGDVAAGAR